jgi:hypothetical protein
LHHDTLLLTLVGTLLIPVLGLAVPGEPIVVEAVDVAPVWSGHPVGFCLLSHGDRQFVAYYDADRRMTVASRELTETEWDTVILPETIGWDSHNYITMHVDDDGLIHLSGNMHVDPLKYFRTTEPLDIHTFQRIDHMVGDREDRVTYPRFMRGPADELIFTYRDGHSGNGEQIFNVYDHGTQEWTRLLDQPLLSGEGQMNAYFTGPTLGPDGYYHLAWMWRNHGGCETNHDLSYARSSDLVHWETSRGEPLELPITLETGEIVDPVPVNGGMINMNLRIGFDHQDRPILSYHKFDDEGLTQAYNARLEDKGWVLYETSDWDYRWEFSGGGSVPALVRVGRVGKGPEGDLIQGWSHWEHGGGIWRLDPDTLEPVGSIERPPSRPPGLGRAQSGIDDVQVRWTGDRGRPSNGTSYQLRWETLGPNRDHPRDFEPPPTRLRLYGFQARGQNTRPPVVVKRGTIECDLVEATPVVFDGKLYRFEYVRDKYAHNGTGDSYFRFVDVETGEPTPAFAHGAHLGSAHVESDAVYVYGIGGWGESEIRVWRSEDLEEWEESVALELPSWDLFNNSVCAAPDGYVMAIEVGGPPEIVGSRFTMRFAHSDDLLTWELLPEDRVYTKTRYSACPAIRYLNGYYYMIYLEALEGPQWLPYIVRSTDLVAWEPTRFGPLMEVSEADKRLANPRLTEAEAEHIAGAHNRNNSDVDLCELAGRTYINYAWGNQVGTEFLAEAEYPGGLDAFLEGWFPEE